MWWGRASEEYRCPADGGCSGLVMCHDEWTGREWRGRNRLQATVSSSTLLARGVLQDYSGADRSAATSVACYRILYATRNHQSTRIPHAETYPRSGSVVETVVVKHNTTHAHGRYTTP